MFLLPGPGVKPESSFFAEANCVLKGYVDHRGMVAQDVSISQVRDGIRDFCKKGFEHFAVVGKFSPRNSSLELQVADEILKYIPEARVTLGHGISGKLNFPRRAATCYLNSATMDIQKDFIKATKEVLNLYGVNCPIYILKADGGTYFIDDSSLQPIQSVQSGIAASIMGAYTFSNGQNGVIVDIGGSSIDMGFLVNGSPLFLPQGIELKNMKTLVQGFLSISIPCGGDTCINFANGSFNIGPERKGPAVAFGGTYPTPTDAMVVKGFIKVSEKQYMASYRALEQFAHKGFVNVQELAEGILDRICWMVLDIINKTRDTLANRPVFNVHQLIEDFNWDMKCLWGMGGASSGLLSMLGTRLGLEPVMLPCAEMTNALGAAVSKPTKQLHIYIDSVVGRIVFIEAGVERKIRQGKKYIKEEMEELVLKEARKILCLSQDVPLEISESESFNVVRDFRTFGQIHHVVVQVKPL
jgi:N-methylhydantoinase A/oxoprolinase/acetone carboxylase beta subunit